MNAEACSLADYLGSHGDRNTRQRETWERFYGEALWAIRRTDASQLRGWLVQSAGHTIGTMASRAIRLFDLIECVARGTWREFKQIFRALCSGELTTYVKDLCRRLWGKLNAIWSRVSKAFTDAKDFIASFSGASASLTIDLTMAFLGSCIGFVLIGGAGDGGFIDADIDLLGIGGHRSIWFHSIFIGLAAESAFTSLFSLQRLLYCNLPDEHLPLWDRLHGLSQRFHAGMIRGCWIGVTTHLAIDSHVDGWTPYKDLPIALPNYAQHLVMDLNAAASGWFAWQWHDKIKRHFRRNAPSLPREISKNGQAFSLPSVDAIGSK